MQIAESNRLILREFEPEDAEGMYLLNVDKEVLRFTGDSPFSSIEEAEVFLRCYDDYRRHGMGRWAVIRKVDDVFMGWCGLKKHDNGMVDLGYRLRKMFWGRGYATESAQLSLRYGFEVLKLDQIVARTHQKNHASIRVIEKLNMSYQENKPVDGLGLANIYAITFEDWIEKKRGF